FYTTSGNPELHSGLPCGAALGVPAALTLSFVPTMCPLQRPRPSPPADAGIRLLCSGPRDAGRTGAAADGGGKFKKFKKCHFFFFSILNMLCPVPCLHFVCSF
ncbi:unnamed protein product, partial [Staurois parvus]